MKALVFVYATKECRERKVSGDGERGRNVLNARRAQRPLSPEATEVEIVPHVPLLLFPRIKHLLLIIPTVEIACNRSPQVTAQLISDNARALCAPRVAETSTKRVDRSERRGVREGETAEGQRDRRQGRRQHAQVLHTSFIQ
jgi:hypothetical protein